MTDKLLSKISLLLSLLCSLVACTSAPESISTNRPQTSSIPTFKIESLSEYQRKGFEEGFPTDARRAFENSDAISIYGNTMDKQPPVLVKLASEKRALLDSLYWDLANSIRPLGPNEARVACKETGPRITTSQPWPDTVSIAISYGCGYFDLYTQKGNASTLFHSRDGLSRPLIRDLFRRENRPDPQLEMP